MKIKDLHYQMLESNFNDQVVKVEIVTEKDLLNFRFVDTAKQLSQGKVYKFRGKTHSFYGKSCPFNINGVVFFPNRIKVFVEGEETERISRKWTVETSQKLKSRVELVFLPRDKPQ